MAPAPKQRTALLAVPGILVAALCLVPFLNKAYVIDDPPFLLEARQILKTPLEPWSFSICWLSNETCVAHASTLGVNAREGLMGYLLVPVILAGGAEWLTHLIQLAIVCLAVFGMVKLALRLGFDQTQAALAGVLLVAIPPLLSMANTAMPDVLALALGLTGIERLLAWKEERQWHQAAVAAFALGSAPYARPHVVLFLPLGALWLLDELKLGPALTQLRRQTVLWLPILLAGLFLLAVNYVTRQRGAGIGAPSIKIELAVTLVNLFAYVHYLSFPIPLSLVWLATRWRRAGVLVVPPMVPLLFAPLMIPTMNLVRELELAAILYGAVCIADMIVFFLRRGHRTNILLGLWILMPLPAILYLHLPLKYLVPVLPAIVVVILRQLSTLSRAHMLAGYVTIVVACVAYSLLLLRADADFADYGRRAAAELIAPRVAAGEKVWYGGEWGFYWYAEQAGARVSKPGEPGPNRGELLAIGWMEGGDTTLNRFPNREFVDSRSYRSPHGRTMGYGAGLYSNRFGLLPWRWNPSATNVYQLWRVH